MNWPWQKKVPKEQKDLLVEKLRNAEIEHDRLVTALLKELDQREGKLA